MGLTRKDAVATGLTASVVLVFLTVDGVRPAAGAILLLGLIGCAQGSPSEGMGARWLAVVGALALAFGVVALVTGSSTALALLVAADVSLWAVATARHALQGRTRSGAGSASPAAPSSERSAG
jgi:hypothetical protein